MAKKIEVILELKDQSFKRGISGANQQVKNLGNNAGKLKLGGAFTSAGPSIAKFATAVAGALAVFKGFQVAVDQIGASVQAGATIENLAIQFKTLTGSAEAGAAAFETVRKAASELPLSLEEIAQGSPALTLIADKVGGLDNAIKLAAGAATSFGIDFQTSASQLQRALTSGAASADTFRERGVNAFVGLQAGATYTAEETAAAFMASFDSITAGIGEAAETFDGKMSMIGDSVFQVRAAFGETFNEALKGVLDFLRESFAANEEAIMSFAKTAANNLVEGLLAAGRGMAFMIDQMTEIAQTIKMIFGPAFNFAKDVVVFFADIATRALGYLLEMIFSLGEAFANFLEFIGVLDEDNALAKFFKNGQVAADDLKDGLEGIPGYIDQIGESAGRVTTAQDAFAELEKSVRDAQAAASAASTTTEELTESTEELTDATKDATDATAKLTKEQEKANKARERAIRQADKIKTQTVGQLAKDRERIQNEIELLDYFGEEKAVKIELNKIEEQRAAALAKIKSLNLGKEEEARRLKEINDLYDEQAQKVEELTRELYESSRSFEQGFKEAYNTFKEDSTNAATLASDLFTQAAADWRNAWVEASETGDLSFKTLIDNMKKRIVAFLADAAFIKLTEALADAFGINIGGKTAGTGGGATSTSGSSSGGSKGGGLGALIDKGVDFVKGLFGFEDGGYVAGNRSIIVGERGPEIFTPSGSGTITPNFAGMGGGTTQVTYNINAVDSASFVDMLSEQPEIIHSLVLDQEQKMFSRRL